MARPALKSAEIAEKNALYAPPGTDLVEWDFEQGWTDGLPVVPPTRARVDAFVVAVGRAAHAGASPPREGANPRAITPSAWPSAGRQGGGRPITTHRWLAPRTRRFSSGPQKRRPA